MNYFDKLWQKTLPIYNKIINHPFNQELANGVLDQEKFRFYIQQDALYLIDFSKALAITASRSPTVEAQIDLLNFAQGALAVERSLHNFYFKQFNITGPTYDYSPANFAYCNYLIATASNHSFFVSLAALAPCFWIYREVGKYIFNQSKENNPYQDWINTYSGEDFNIVVNKYLSIINSFSSNLNSEQKILMEKAFITSALLEWNFWDNAYNLTKWQPTL